MHFPAEDFHGKGMAEFVQRFDDWEQEPEKHQVLRRGHAVDETGSRVRPVRSPDQHSRNHDAEPQQRAAPPEEGIDQ